MTTKVIAITEENRDAALYEAGEIIKAGGLVAFPTETVYGLGGDALNPASARKIYEAKGRPSDNPLIVHIAEMEALPAIVESVSETAKKLASLFWPGPLTMIFKKSERVPRETTGGLDTVAVRMPVHDVARDFIRAAGGYVAAPSANRSGRPSPTAAEYVAEDMEGRIEMILDGGQAVLGLESTILDLTVEPPMLLRPGFVTEEMLEVALGEVAVDETLIRDDSGQAPKAPGMKYRHYAPKGELILVKGSAEAVTERINAILAEGSAKNKKTGVIATNATIGNYAADVRFSVGEKGSAKTAAERLYRILRECDDEGVELICSECFDGGGVGAAVMNRLMKAAGHRVVEA
ncbi:MAG: L-threonylcarbamoyladenylate synthase [Bacteroidales bacterium]|nr:L-threonylcarbamoyladenylate synthase [Bacteroidales bacterium]MCM1416186.1 L-threonylcarbamoyladenylate synthase [bacterium]MCM1424211.1 L-threonylcarbamoyladenylate synthase [bacterium]